MLIHPHLSPSVLLAVHHLLQIDNQVRQILWKQNKTAAVSVKDLTPALPVATSTTSVGTGQNVLGVETNKDNKGHVEMDKSHLHVETLNNNKGTSQVETTADKGVTLHVHVETPEDVSPNTNSVVSADTQKPVQESASTNQPSVLPAKSAKLIDVWCNKTTEYYQFVPSAEILDDLNNTGYSLCARKPKVTANGLCLRKTNTVNYTPMLDSDADDTDDVKKSAPNKIRPKLDGPSTAVIRAHAHIQNKKQKSFKTKPIPVLPVRNNLTVISDNIAVNVETSASPVEMTPPDDSETEGYVNSDTDSQGKQPVIGTLMMKTVGIVKCKKKRKAWCKLCGASCNSVKELNHHHKENHDIVFCQACNKAFSACTSLDKHMYVHKELDYMCDQCGQSYPFEN